MKAFIRLTICCALLMAPTAYTLAQTVQTDFDHHANFAQYKNYSWVAIDAADSLWEFRIKNAVNGQLAAKGWTDAEVKADSPFAPSPSLLAGAADVEAPKPGCVPSSPCVAVVAFQTTHNQRSVDGFFDGMGGWRGGGIGEATFTAQNYKEGTLLVAMYDANTKQLLWRGTAEGTLSGKAEKNEKNLNKAVAKMFSKFPAGVAR